MADDAESTDPGSGDADSADAASSSVFEIIRVPVLALIAGVVAGFVGGGFRWCLERLDSVRIDLFQWSHGITLGWLIPIAVSAAAAAVGAGIGRWVPLSAGSGIQHVEAVDRGQADPPPLRVVPARFVGGLVSIGLGGLVLGREGPTVHMAAAIGAAVGRYARVTIREVRELQTVLSGAGLAVAFNAPVSATIFVFEEVTKRVRVRDTVATMFAAATAVGCSRLILGDHPDFVVEQIGAPALTTLPIFAVFGLVMGLIGVAYTRTILGCMSLFDQVTSVSPIVKAAAIGAIIGAALYLNPLSAGGGDGLSQDLLFGHSFAIVGLLGLIAFRFVAGPLSYSAGTPGGLFAPILALGTLSGFLFNELVAVAVPGLHTDLRIALALVGMTTLFAAVVQAPFTGIVLAIEMTAVTGATIPMLVGTGVAMIVARVADSPPIYDALRERMLRSGTVGPPAAPGPLS